jgi:hypothetical protein
MRGCASESVSTGPRLPPSLILIARDLNQRAADPLHFANSSALHKGVAMTRERLQYLSLCVTDMRATVGALPASFDSVEAFCAAFDEMRFVRNLGEELACAIDQDAVPRTGGQRDEHDTGKQGMQTDVTTELETINAALTDVRAALGKLRQRRTVQWAMV